MREEASRFIQSITFNCMDWIWDIHGRGRSGGMLELYSVFNYVYFNSGGSRLRILTIHA